MIPLSRLPRLVRPQTLRSLPSPRRLIPLPRHPLLHLRTTSTQTPSATAPITATPPPDSTAFSVYTPPTTGLISHLPAPFIPYAELLRLDKPAGTYYLLLPCLWSTLLSSSLLLSPLPSVLHTCLLFTTGAFIMRGAGCAINDLWDRRIDPKVSRTKFRPLARGAISVPAAVTFTASQLLLGLGVLVQFPTEVIWAAIPSLLVVGAYPGMKRVTNYPQVVLGVAFSWGAWLGFPAMGMGLMEPGILATAGFLAASNTAWTVLYDTVYAMQDRKDDLKAGVKGTAVVWGEGEEGLKKVLWGLAGLQVGLLGAAGVVSGMGLPFFVWSCGGSAVGLGYMIRRVKIGDEKGCGEWFRWCAWAVGGVGILGGLGAEYTWRKWKAGEIEEVKAEEVVKAIL